MREGRVIAFAGVLQACAQVRALAQSGRWDPAVAGPALESILRIDAESAAAVFGGVQGVRTGLGILLQQADGAQRDLPLMQLVISVLRLERRLALNPGLQRDLRSGVLAIAPDAQRLGVEDADVVERLAGLYVSTLSTLQPRIVVHGEPRQLADPAVVSRIRALLLAAIRATVLWRQVGGSRLRLLVRRREYAMLARGLQARSTLDHG